MNPLWGFPAHFTVTDTLGIFFGPGLRTTISRFDVVARRWADGKLAEMTSTGKSPFGSFASWRGPLPHPASAIAARQIGTRTDGPTPRCGAILPKAAARYHGVGALRRSVTVS